MSKTIKNVEETVMQQLGAASALFMSNPLEGTKQVMPTQELEAIGKEIIEAVKQFALSERADEIQTADVKLKEEYGEDWLQYRDDRLAELHNAGK